MEVAVIISIISLLVSAVAILLNRFDQTRDQEPDPIIKLVEESDSPYEVSCKDRGEPMAHAHCVVFSGTTPLASIPMEAFDGMKKAQLNESQDKLVRKILEDGEQIRLVVCARGIRRLNKSWFMWHVDVQEVHGALQHFSSDAAPKRTKASGQSDAHKRLGIPLRVDVTSASVLLDGYSADVKHAYPPGRRERDYEELAGLVETTRLAPSPLDEVKSEIIELLDPSSEIASNQASLKKRMNLADDEWAIAIDELVATGEVEFDGNRIRLASSKDETRETQSDNLEEIVFGVIPENGQRISGGVIETELAALGHSKPQVREAIKQLAEASRIVSFRGRGGTYCRPAGSTQQEAILRALPDDGTKSNGRALQVDAGLSEIEFRASIGALVEKGRVKPFRGKYGQYAKIEIEEG